MLHIENFTLNFYSNTSQSEDLLNSQSKFVVREELVNTLRIISEDARIQGQDVMIPDDCEKYGFAQGTHDLSTLLHFLADMLE